jgi:hypothetical protein
MDIQAWLDKEGVKISIAALRKYLAEGRAKRSSKGPSAGRPAKRAGEAVREAPLSSGDAKPSPDRVASKNQCRPGQSRFGPTAKTFRRTDNGELLAEHLERGEFSCSRRG